MTSETFEALMFIKANLKEQLWNDVDLASALNRFTKKETTASQEEWWKDWEQFSQDKETNEDQREVEQCLFCPRCNCL